MEVRFARDKNSSSLSHLSPSLLDRVQKRSLDDQKQFNLNHVVMNDGKCVVKDGCVGMTLNCLNGKSFIPGRGRGRGMTNFQLCGSGNWETEDHPVIKSKKRRFAS